jgi:hypothetical protein
MARRQIRRVFRAKAKKSKAPAPENLKQDEPVQVVVEEAEDGEEALDAPVAKEPVKKSAPRVKRSRASTKKSRASSKKS